MRDTIAERLREVRVRPTVGAREQLRALDDVRIGEAKASRCP